MIDHRNGGRRNKGYLSQRKYIQGSGFIDSVLSSARSIGSYIAQNKDLIAKPLLGAVGNLAAAGLTEGGIALLNRIKNKNKNQMHNKLDAKSQEILQNIIEGKTSAAATPVTNIIGSGIKKF